MSLIKNIIKHAGVASIVIGACMLPLIFSSSCYFDPDAESLTDTATYAISGIVTSSSDGEPIEGIRVFFRDSASSYQSAYDVTDTSGYYSLSISYMRKYALQLQFLDLDGTYNSTTVEITFDDSYFKYGYQKYKDIELTTK